MEMAGKTGTAQVRRITMSEHLSGVRKNQDLPWQQRDHALFVVLRAGRSAALCLSRRGRAWRRRLRRGGPHRPRHPAGDAAPRSRARDRSAQKLAMAPEIMRWPEPLTTFRPGGAVGRRKAPADHLEHAVLHRADRRASASPCSIRRPTASIPGPCARQSASSSAWPSWSPLRWSISASACATPMRSTASRSCCWSIVDIAGEIGMGAQRWIDLEVIQLQPSELMKIALVLALARYFHRLSAEDIGNPLALIVPILMVFAPGGAGADAARSRHRGHAGAGRRRHVLRRRRAAVEVRRRHAGRARRGPGGLELPARLSEEPHPHLPQPGERSAGRRLSHHCSRRSRSAPAACSARASCTARRAI